MLSSASIYTNRINPVRLLSCPISIYVHRNTFAVNFMLHCIYIHALSAKAEQKVYRNPAVHQFVSANSNEDLNRLNSEKGIVVRNHRHSIGNRRQLIF